MLTLSANCSTSPIAYEGSVSISVHDIFMSASGPTPSRRSHDWPAAHPASLAQPREQSVPSPSELDSIDQSVERVRYRVEVLDRMSAREAPQRVRLDW